MIFKRVYANLRGQNWIAILIELLIVVFGVFIGMQASNWNENRLQRAETRRMLAQARPQLELMAGYFETARAYYDSVGGYSKTAIAGWDGDPAVDDSTFVIAAYQASQIYGFGANGATWATILGSDQLRNIEDPRTRANMSFLMSSDYSPIEIEAIDTPYRQNVRRMIPVSIQQAIREKCGDHPSRQNKVLLVLPARCDLRIPAGEAAQTAAALRSTPELKRDLQWHTAAIATFLTNMERFERTTRELRQRLEGAPADNVGA
jgi:hypothetical protein